MNSKVKQSIIFGLGVAVGGVATWLYLDKQYKAKWKQAEEEIREAREFYLNETHKQDADGADDNDDDPETIINGVPAVDEDDHINDILMGVRDGVSYYASQPDATTYEQILERANYRKQERLKQEEESGMADPLDDNFDIEGSIYVIDINDFDTIGNDVVSMDYYSDGVLVDEDDQIVEDIRRTVGDAIEQLERSGEDEIYVRNDYYEVDYEIIRDGRPYHDEPDLG